MGVGYIDREFSEVGLILRGINLVATRREKNHKGTKGKRKSINSTNLEPASVQDPQYNRAVES